MAVLPDYVSGTISLSNGSTTVTGTGTLFQVAAFKAGDTLQIQNLTAVIASVNSNTSLTLTAPWTGTTLTNAAYRARYLPDGARVTAQTTTLIEVLGNGKLQSIAGLTGAADKGLMLTGPETAGTFDLTPFSRQLLDDANAAAWQNTLGLTGNAIADMIQDSYGVYNSSSVDSNLDNLLPGARGLYTYTSGSVGFPVNSGLWFVETQRMFAGSTSSMRQIATRYNTSTTTDPLVYTRIRGNTGVWGSWVALTAQSGQNNNGSFTVLPGQIQICHGFVTFDASGLVSWIFPKSFSSTPVIHGIGFGTVNTGLVVNLTARSSTSASFRSIRTDTGASVQMGCPVIAIGAA